jgi:hypothetical protein
MAGLVITFPSLVLVALDRGTGIDPSKVKIEMPATPSDSGEIPQFQIK